VTSRGSIWASASTTTPTSLTSSSPPPLTPAITPALTRQPPSSSSQTGLDALVTRIAVEVMSVTSNSLHDSLEWMLRVLNEFFAVDTSFLRHNDFDREVTVLVAEWPRRVNVPDPDPLGEVPFGHDPAFDMTLDLKEAVVIRPAESPDSYQDRVEQGAGVSGVSVAMVPLLLNDRTDGVLGFIKFGDRRWDEAETNALQAVASLMVHLQARVEAEDRLRYQAHHDELTDLPNRRSLLANLQRRLRAASNRTIGLIFIHLDRFKAVNDSLGLDAGDELLVSVARRLQGAMGPGDLVARAGGEFVVVLERPAIEFDALALADELMTLIAEPVEIRGHLVSRTASVGVSFGEGPSATIDDLLAHAGAALQRSKARGGNQVVVFDEEMRDAVAERASVELQLRQAISLGGLLLYYQPEFDLRTGQLLAVEALVRWDHPERGILAAGEFIAIAEEAGLIADLGSWVLAEACRQMAVWQTDYPDLAFTMRVNMSPAQLSTRDIVGVVNDCLQANQLPGRLLCLEITEHALVQDVTQTVRVLNDLRSLGVSLAIDDFGTGYSSMSQLKQLPVDVLKIDQTFVGGLGVDGRDRAIVDATVRLAHAFGLEVVAEGVETAELVHELVSLGCHRAQGYHLSRPKPPADFIPLLRQGGLDPTTVNPQALLFVPGDV
jgi:diguanylate cyclase (GGDEF)-like protein